MSGLRHPLLLALGWTLLHTLWQGALAGAATALLLCLLRRASAQARHLAACAGLAACLFLPAATLVRLWPSAETARVQLTPPAGPLPAPAALDPTPAPPPSLAARAEGLLRPVLPWIVGAWSLGVLALLLRFTGGWWWLRRLRRRSTRPAPGEWQVRLAALAARIGLASCPELRLCGAAEGPLVHGWWKPAVLLPASLLTGMSPELLEALLAHELAHIRRQDYLVNLLQGLVETLLFYHPAVWWISSRVRATREEACDDLAARAIGEPRRLARALAELDLFQLPAPALGAHQGDLMTRITRLLHPPQPRPLLGGLLPALFAASLLSPLLASPSPHPETALRPAAPVAQSGPGAGGAGPQAARLLRLSRRQDRVSASLSLTRAELDRLLAETWNRLFVASGEDFELTRSLPPLRPGEGAAQSLDVKDADPAELLGQLGARGLTPAPGSEAWLRRLPPGEASGELQRLPSGDWDVRMRILCLGGCEAEFWPEGQDKPLARMTVGEMAGSRPLLRAEYRPRIRMEGTSAPVMRVRIQELGTRRWTETRMDLGPGAASFSLRLDGGAGAAPGTPTAQSLPADAPLAPVETRGSLAPAAPPEPLTLRAREIRAASGRPEPRPPQAWALLKTVPIRYPKGAWEHGIQGLVTLEIKVDAQGLPVGLRAVEGPEALARECLATVGQWRFEPPASYGLRAPVTFLMGFQFEHAAEPRFPGDDLPQRYASIDFIISGNAMRGRR